MSHTYNRSSYTMSTLGHACMPNAARASAQGRPSFGKADEIYLRGIERLSDSPIRTWNIVDATRFSYKAMAHFLRAHWFGFVLIYLLRVSHIQRCENEDKEVLLIRLDTVYYSASLFFYFSGTSYPSEGSTLDTMFLFFLITLFMVHWLCKVRSIVFTVWTIF